MTPRELAQHVRAAQTRAKALQAKLPPLAEAEQVRQAEKARAMKALMPEGFELFRELCQEGLCDGYRSIIEVKAINEGSREGAGNGAG